MSAPFTPLQPSGPYAAVTNVLFSLYAPVYMYIFYVISVYFSLQVKNEPLDGVAICAFILGAGMVMNIFFYHSSFSFHILHFSLPLCAFSPQGNIGEYFFLKPGNLRCMEYPEL